jgi:putative transposase
MVALPWKTTSEELERVKFIAALESAPETGASFSEICRSAGISRPTGYKWLARFREDGAAGLMRRKPVAYQHPNATPLPVADAIADVRRDHPTWGPKKVGAYLRRKRPDLVLPACSTIGEILDRRGFILPRKRRVYVPPSPAVLSTYSCPNAVWCVDHKGHFPLANGDRCGPLTMIDGFSRFLLRCQAVSTRIEDNRPIIESAMHEFGLPAAIRSDGGTPFATQGVAGRLNAMTIWWIKMGIEIHRSEPGKPQQNGRLERLHKTLEEAIRGGPYSLEVQQRRFDFFRREYNEERPHESLDQEIPASKYQMSWRAYPEVIKSPEYPSGIKVRRVAADGRASWSGHVIPFGVPLGGEPIGFEEVDNDVWNVFFGSFFLMAVDLREGKLAVRHERALPTDENSTSAA